MKRDNVFQNLPENLLHPPVHAWDGPQPGLSAQADERCRYYFSGKTGRLERIVQHDVEGAPELCVKYRYSSSDPDSKPHPFEAELWDGSEFISHGMVRPDGSIICDHSFPRTMITEHGDECQIPLDESGVFITPSGSVVRLMSEGTWLSRPRAAYMGRVKNFNPLRPFFVKTHEGQQEISVDQQDVVIDPHGHVFEFGSHGLRACGELVIPELSDAPQTKGVSTISHDLFILQLIHADDPSVEIEIRDPHIHAVLGGSLPTIVGRHPFIHKSVPEMADVHGGTTAEEKLRAVERAALELGLIFFALRHEKKTNVRGVFLKAQQIVEEKLWKSIDDFERGVGADRHTIINPTQLRAWIDLAATHPHDALTKLKTAIPSEHMRMQQPYAAAR